MKVLWSLRCFLYESDSRKRFITQTVKYISIYKDSSYFAKI